MQVYSVAIVDAMLSFVAYKRCPDVVVCSLMFTDF